MRKYLDGMCEMARLEITRRKASLDPAGPAATAGRAASPTASDECPLLIEPFAPLSSDAGSFYSFKAREQVNFSSRFQADVLTMLEWDYAVDEYHVNGFGKSCGRQKQLMAGLEEVLVLSSPIVRREAKIFDPTVYLFQTREVLARNWGQIKPTLRLARKDAALTGRRYRLLTDAAVSKHLAANARFFLRYRGPRFLIRTMQESAIVEHLERTMMSMDDEFTPNTLLAHAGAKLGRRDEMATWLWHLYAEHIVQCDMLKPFTMDSLSWRCGNLGYAFPSDRPDWRQPANEWRR